MSDEKPRPRQLGRGLEALFGEDRTNIAAAEAAVEAGATPAPATEDSAGPATPDPAAHTPTAAAAAPPCSSPCAVAVEWCANADSTSLAFTMPTPFTPLV